MAQCFNAMRTTQIASKAHLTFVTTMLMKIHLNPYPKMRGQMLMRIHLKPYPKMRGQQKMMSKQ